ncbi:uncharacterized protein A4U43_C08F14980 [Asparagus officinalis]|nr:uncharacterized protein A4U43_C08F14980 [Asparagus officinalis]
MRNEGQRPQGSRRNNGFMRSFSSYLRIVSNGALNMALTVKSAGVSVASSLAERDEDDARDQYYPSLNRSRCCMKGICTDYRVCRGPRDSPQLPRRTRHSPKPSPSLPPKPHPLPPKSLNPSPPLPTEQPSEDLPIRHHISQPQPQLLHDTTAARAPSVDHRTTIGRSPHPSPYLPTPAPTPPRHRRRPCALRRPPNDRTRASHDCSVRDGEISPRLFGGRRRAHGRRDVAVQSSRS